MRTRKPSLRWTLTVAAIAAVVGGSLPGNDSWVFAGSMVAIGLGRYLFLTRFQNGLVYEPILGLNRRWPFVRRNAQPSAMLEEPEELTPPPPLATSVARMPADNAATWLRWAAISFPAIIVLIVAFNAVGVVLRGDDTALAVLEVGAELLSLGALVWVGRRVSGSFRGFARDVGLSRPGRADVKVWLAGCGAQLAAAVVLGYLIQLVAPDYNLSKASNTVGLDHVPVFPLVLLGVAAVLLAPIAEEAQFRGLLLRAGMQRTTFPIAAGISSVLFGLLHGYEVDSWSGALVLVLHITVFGFVQCLVVRRTDRITPTVMIHATLNAVAVAVAAS